MHVLSLSHTGFGINTNILETNVLNLAVVIAFLFIYGKDIFIEVLNTRRERIVKAIERAEEKYKEAQAALRKAKLQFAGAQYKAIKIRSANRIVLKRIRISVLNEAKEEQIRLRKNEFEKQLLLETKAQLYIKDSLCSLIAQKAPFKFANRYKNISDVVTSLHWINSYPEYLLKEDTK